MKTKSILPNLFFIFLIFSSENLFSQEKINLSKLNTIQSSAISTKRIKGKTVKNINPTALKQGFNRMSLDSKKVLLVEYANKRVVSVVVTNSMGVVIDRITLGTGVSKYECSGAVCACEGDDDCNDMFENAGCGSIASCANGSCWCLTLGD